MPQNRIAAALERLFEKHRIVFWYDAKRELRADFEALDLPDVEKVIIANNEFGLKYHILREAPKQKFLLYREGPPPDDLNNWLLDVQLAHGQFRTDQVSIWLSELELGLEFTQVIRAHAEFFASAKRKDALKRLIRPDDTQGMIRLKMVGICAAAEPRVDSVLENLLAELADDRDEKIRLIDRCGLSQFLWEQMNRACGYASEEPGLRDFAIELFKSCYAMETDGPVQMTGDARVFLNRWKDSRRFQAAFETLSEECAGLLGIEQDLEKRDFRDLMELDDFKLIDQKIISDLVKAILFRTVAANEVANWVRRRRQSHWYEEFRDIYEALDFAARFLRTLDETELTMTDMADGISRYAGNWYRLDQYYRKFICHVRKSGQASLMGELNEAVENQYVNNFLLKLNDRWQTLADSAQKWAAYPIPPQNRFFETWVSPFLKKETRICVIISDALRFEIGEELLSLIRQEDRYSAEIEPMLAMLPSFTQLGMAALLPNRELTISEDETGTVFVDGRTSRGTANRIKILKESVSPRATALKADELMTMNREDCRSLVRDHDLIYIYHNRIDGTGDKRDSEERVFEAAQEALTELIRLIKKLAGANVNNILVTADHGFIYQNRPIEESDYSAADPKGDAILFRDRRFILGRGLKDAPGLRRFTPEQLGLAGEIEALIPASINRLRLRGSGSRYVHGGASLQETVIPLIRINKKRKSDVSTVDVEILRGSSTVITSGQLAVTLYQREPVTEKMQPRTLRAGIYTEDDELISDRHELTFDLASENTREREFSVRFMLTSAAEAANDQEVILRLEEKHAGTSHYVEYRTQRYRMRRSFTSDFDF